ncbi:MAG: nucleotidyltransferase domain-containing protein [Candidatus Methanoperedens sp.]|nr:nucleotidyltransferase domain-containing protein [Candidatus Methanoperedens sp.]
MHKIRRIDVSRSKELFEEINGFVNILTSHIDIKKVYLFGSVAHDDFNEGSDIDLAIIGDFKERFLNRPGRILEMTELPIEPLCYTKMEFEKTKRKGNPFIKEILKGKLLYSAKDDTDIG